MTSQTNFSSPQNLSCSDSLSSYSLLRKSTGNSGELYSQKIRKRKIKSGENMTIIARLTGPEGSDTINPSWKAGIGGTDLGHTINHKDRVYFVFGDTFSSETCDNNNPQSGKDWRWNTMAFSTDMNPSDGIIFDGWITDDNGKAKQLIKDTRYNPITNIPTGGISINGTIYLWYMSMKFWGDKNDSCWQSYFAGLAASEDDGQNFKLIENYQFPCNSNFGMIAAAEGNDDPELNDGYIYLWGTPSNRCGGIKLARFKPENIEDLSKYQFLKETDISSAGKPDSFVPEWISNENEAAFLVNKPAGEMSVMYNKWCGKWIMLYGTYNHPEALAYDTVLRYADKPWGPWSEPVIVVPHKQPGGPYGCYMNKHYVENSGEYIYFILSLWNPYDIFLVKIKLVAE